MPTSASIPDIQNLQRMHAVLEDHWLLVETPKQVRRIGVSARVGYLVKWKGCLEHESVTKSEMDRYDDLIKDSVGAVLVRKGFLVTVLLQNSFSRVNSLVTSVFNFGFPWQLGVYALHSKR